MKRSIKLNINSISYAKGELPMLCPNCGSENTEDSMFCNKCGAGLLEENAPDKIPDFEELEGQKKTLNNKIRNFGFKFKKIAIIRLMHVKAFVEKYKIGFAQNKKRYTGFSILALLLIVGVIASVLYYNTPIKKIERLYNNEEYAQAKALYSETIAQEDDVKNREMLNSKLKDFLNKKASEIEEDYVAMRIDYRIASNNLSNMKQFWVAENEATSALDKINKLENSRNCYKVGLKKIADKNVIEGVEELSKVIKEDPNYNDAKKQIAKVLPSLKKQGLLKAENAYKANDYKGAVNSIELLSKYCKNDSEIKAKLEFYKAENEKAIELEKQRKEARKQELLARTTANYDDMTKETIIVPKGYSTRYVNIDWDMNIYPEIIIDSSGKASFVVCAGFKQEDWIFFENILFDADGYQFTWDISGLHDTNTEVFWGGIAEWTIKFAVSDESAKLIEKYSDYLSDSNKGSNELVEQMTKLCYANTAKMRFNGQGYRDHILTDGEKANLRTFIELYSFYESQF